MDARIFDPRTFSIPAGDGQRFGPLDTDGKGILRTSVDEYNFETGLKAENGRVKHYVDIRDDGKPIPYRAEFTDWPWMLNMPIGTYELIMYEQMITTPINMQSPISIFQGYARPADDPSGQNHSVTQQLELSGYKQISGANVGQLQIINVAAKNADGKHLRKVTEFTPEQNVPFLVMMEILHESKERGGHFKVSINGEVLHDSNETTVVEGTGVCGQPKFGIYHHYLRTDWQTWAPINVAAGHTKFYLETGPITIIRFSPGEKRPTYHYALANSVRPSEILKRYYGGGYGNYDQGFADGVKQEVDSLSTYTNSRK
jgi:hypothetical protein